MSTIWKKDGFKIVGHRGAAALAPENTLAGIRRALKEGVDGIEIDVHEAHGRLWVIHDPDLGRTTNGKGRLEDHPVTALRGFDAGQGEQIPFLEEVLDLVVGKTLLNIEIKDPQATALLVELLHERRAGEEVLITSFSGEALRSIREMDAHLQLGVLFSKARQWGQALKLAEALDALSVNPNYRAITDSGLEDAKRGGYRVYSYTVNDGGLARRLRDSGVDGVFTDRPDLIRELRENGA